MFLIVVLIVFTWTNNEAYSQNRYQPFMTKNGVAIDYKWSHSIPFNKNSPLELRLRIRNTNEHAINTVFEVDFYMGPVIAESSQRVELCILPGRWKTGRTNGVYFQTLSLTNDQIRSEDFKWEINKITVEKIDECTEMP